MFLHRGRTRERSFYARSNNCTYKVLLFDMSGAQFTQNDLVTLWLHHNTTTN